MNITSSKLVISAVKKEQYPCDEYPSIAMAGRSNVGKSTLVNSLLNRKMLARVSSTPGKTRTINFYLANEEFYLVDLPGYGYAKLSKIEKENWGKVMEEYFMSARNLKCLFLLLDIRHEPKDTDIQMYNFCRYYEIPIRIILTKSDKLTKNKINQAISNMKKIFNLREDEKIFSHSSLNKNGRDEILQDMEKLIVGEKC